MLPKTWKEIWNTWDMTAPAPAQSCPHFGWPSHLPLVVSCVRWCPLSQPKNHIKTFEYRIHWNINIRKNKLLSEKRNGIVGWNKHLGE